MQKAHLQKHRIAAFTKTLILIDLRLQRNIKFLEDYAAVYRFPKMLTRRNLKQLQEWQKAAKLLQSLEPKNL